MRIDYLRKGQDYSWAEHVYYNMLLELKEAEMLDAT